MSGLQMPYVGSYQEPKIIVPCKNGSLYGKKMSSLHVAGVCMYSDYTIRFRASDNKVVVADLLVGVGRHDNVKTSTQYIKNMLGRNDTKIHDLKSMDVDKVSTGEVISKVDYR